MKFDREEFDRQSEERQLFFARFCWLNKNKTAPSGLTWAQVFEKKEGITLREYEVKRNGTN